MVQLKGNVTSARQSRLSDNSSVKMHQVTYFSTITTRKMYNVYLCKSTQYNIITDSYKDPYQYSISFQISGFLLLQVKQITIAEGERYFQSLKIFLFCTSQNSTINV